MGNASCSSQRAAAKPSEEVIWWWQISTSRLPSGTLLWGCASRKGSFEPGRLQLGSESPVFGDCFCLFSRAGPVWPRYAGIRTPGPGPVALHDCLEEHGRCRRPWRVRGVANGPASGVFRLQGSRPDPFIQSGCLLEL